MIFFTATVLPLICTPGPDMLFVASQALSGGASAGLRSTAGVCLGYVVHSALAALGVAAIIAASPMLFEALRWLGVAYMIYLAFQLMRSAMKAGQLTLSAVSANRQLRRGFLTAFLNPKGMMIYFAVLPQFMQHGGSIPLQVLILSAIFIALCGTVYMSLSLGIAAVGRNGGFSDCRRRWVEGTAGAFLIVAAGRLAAI
ncbi:threonine/homoserine/homoserine lactone efflux protein [Phyllobacterium bourgognense]|uniref:Threonine/homoserine/homoserine lactone efflux protein n=2 Tax=Phyllobacterium bourgognense TaxID=314236 RepID=A0A368YGQ5_9HYPH|nr:threonine/homoserine/homoserine lactone efflux protein [Phyllobacterium bourgognense]